MDKKELTHSFPSTISKEQVNKLPLIRYDGPIQIVKTIEDALEAAEALRKHTVLGFDTETRPAFTKGEFYQPSLLQLATEAQVYLFQLQLMGNLEPIIPILDNPKILKVGVAIRDDIKALQAITAFEPTGFLEISTITSQYEIQNTGLRALCGIFLKARISKRSQISNWAKPDLSQAQLTYAATDAWICHEIYAQLCKHGMVE